MIRLPQIKTRIVRLRESAEVIDREVNAQKRAEELLTPLGRRRYVDATTARWSGRTTPAAPRRSRLESVEIDVCWYVFATGRGLARKVECEEEVRGGQSAQSRRPVSFEPHLASAKTISGVRPASHP